MNRRERPWRRVATAAAFLSKHLQLLPLARCGPARRRPSRGPVQQQQLPLHAQTLSQQRSAPTRGSWETAFTLPSHSAARKRTLRWGWACVLFTAICLWIGVRLMQPAAAPEPRCNRILCRWPLLLQMCLPLRQRQRVCLRLPGRAAVQQRDPGLRLAIQHGASLACMVRTF